MTLEEQVKQLVHDQADLSAEVVEFGLKLLDDPHSEHASIPTNVAIDMLIAKVNGVIDALLLLAREMDARA